MNNSFWFNEPSILLRKDKILQLWPYESMNFAFKKILFCEVIDKFFYIGL